MSDTVIADVGETLISLLREKMGDLIQDTNSIALLSPAEAAEQNISLSLFLYSVGENMYMRNQEVIDINSTQLQQPPLVLDLYYLLTTYSTVQGLTLMDRTSQEHRILGRAMSVFYDHSILNGSILQGSLAGSNEQLRITLNPVSLPDLTGIWSAFPNQHYRPSVSYIVSPVAIDSTRVTSTKRIVERQVKYSQIETKS